MNAGAVAARPPSLVAYGLLAVPLAFAALPLYVHIPRFYNETAGLELALLGAILLAARLFDAGIDPWLGWLADRWSPARLVFLSLPFFALGFIALLNPPTEHAALWLTASLLLTTFAYSAASVAYQAWGVGLGRDSAARTRLTAAREGCGLLGVVLAAVAPSLLAAQASLGIARLAWILPVLLGVAAAALLFLPNLAQRAAAERRPPSADLRAALADAGYRRLLAVYVCNGIAAALPATLFPFFVADVVRHEAAAGPLLALYFVAGAASLPLWVAAARRHGRILAWLAAMVLAIVGFAGAVWLGPGDLWPFAAVCLASGLALGADLALPAAIAADFGRREGRPGACFGIWSFAGKLNLALAAGLALPLLDALGYEPGQGGTASLSFAYAILPLVFKALAGILLWRWRHHLEVES